MIEKESDILKKTDVSQNSIYILLQIAIMSLLGIFNSILLVGGINSYYLFLGSEIYGRLGYIQNIIIIFTPFLYLGFLLTLTKKIAEYYAINDELNKQRIKYTTIFAFKTISVATIIFYAIFILLIIPNIYQSDILHQFDIFNMTFYFALFGITWIINIITVVSTGVLQGFQKYRYVTTSVSISNFFITICYLILIFTSNLNLFTVAIVLLISELIKGIIVLIYGFIFLKKYQILEVEMNLTSQQISEERSELIKIGGIFIILNFFHIFIFYFDKILIYFFLNDYVELAYYILASYMFTFLFPLSCAIFNSLLPASSEQNILQNKENLIKYVNFGLKYALYISVIFAIFMGTVFSQIMPVIYGELGQNSIIYLGFFAAILVFETLFSPLGNVLVGINVRKYAITYSLRATLNIILWPLLFYIFQNIIGILVGSIISSFFWYITGIIYLREYIEMKNFIKLIPKVILPTILIISGYILLLIINFFTSTAIFFFILKIGVFTLIISGIYVLFIALMKGFTPEDLNTLEKGINFIPGSKIIISILRKISGHS